MDHLQLYNLENYLFETVRCRFQENGFLSAFDFFCIIVWKANRAKSKVAKKLLAKGYDTLDAAVYELTSGLAKEAEAKDKLRYLWDWGGWEFYLPMASAILTILYPEEFTIYDVRVCGVLGGFHDLSSISKFEKLWPRYQEFKVAVEQAAPAGLSLRDKDRYLWGKSFYQQLSAQVQSGFTKVESDALSIQPGVAPDALL